MTTPVPRRLIRVAAAIVLVLGLAACGDDDGGSDPAVSPGGTSGEDSVESGGGGDAPEDDAAAAGDDGGEGDAAPAPPGPGGGTLVIGDETIELTSSLCFLESQDAAAGGGEIEFNAQASGTNAAGEEVSVDASRYSEESDFAGDDVSLIAGSPSDPTLQLGFSTGDIEVASDVLSFEGDLMNSDTGESVPVSFTIEC